MLAPPTLGRGFQRKSPRIDGRQIRVYVLQYRRTMSCQSKSILSYVWFRCCFNWFSSCKKRVPAGPGR